MPPVLKAKDDQQHLLRLSIVKESNNAARKVKTLVRGMGRKRFSELSTQDKEDLLKAVAIHLGFIRAD